MRGLGRPLPGLLPPFPPSSLSPWVLRGSLDLDNLRVMFQLPSFPSVLGVSSPPGPPTSRTPKHTGTDLSPPPHTPLGEAGQGRGCRPEQHARRPAPRGPGCVTFRAFVPSWRTSRPSWPAASGANIFWMAVSWPVICPCHMHVGPRDRCPGSRHPPGAPPRRLSPASPPGLSEATLLAS